MRIGSPAGAQDCELINGLKPSSLKGTTGQPVNRFQGVVNFLGLKIVNQ
jgi:hypothetical protein